jgi:hypothetical protein
MKHYEPQDPYLPWGSLTMARPTNDQAAAIAAKLAADGESQAEITEAITTATGMSERQARRYAAEPAPVVTSHSLERLCDRLQNLFARADATSDYKAAAALSKQLMDAYHRLDLARQAEAHAYDTMPW